MIETCENPSESSAARIAPTRPSIISLGLTTSAPARAYISSQNSYRTMLKNDQLESRKTRELSIYKSKNNS